MGSAIYCNRCGLQSGADAQFCQSCGDSLRAIPPEPAPLPALSQTYEASPGNPLLPRVHYAGFWIRVVASLFDLMVAFVVFVPTRMLVGSSVTLAGEAWQLPVAKTFLMGRMVRIGFAVGAGWLYRAGMESSRFQATLGKLLMQIKVTDLNGNRISFERATGRYLAKFVSGVTLGIGYVMVGFTPKKTRSSRPARRHVGSVPLTASKS